MPSVLITRVPVLRIVGAIRAVPARRSCSLCHYGYRLWDFGGRKVPLDAQRLEEAIPWGTSTNVIVEPRR